MSQRKLEQLISLGLNPSLRADRRSELRHTIRLPVQVTGFDGRKDKWVESTETVNVSPGGLALRLSKQVMIGDILHIEVPLPERLRIAGSPSIFKSYAMVRCIANQQGKQTVRLQFTRRSAGSSPAR
jgi:hypothetical protein